MIIRKVFKVIPALAILTCAASRLNAESGGAFQFFEDEAMVITSAKRAQPVSKAAASASVITAEDIRTYGYRTLGDALQSIPGFYVTDDRNYTYLWVRGFGRPSDYTSRVLFLLNGHRMNENIYGQPFIGNEYSLDMNSISKIEVIKGPGAALYGDNAFFAVINVITKPAPQDQSVNAGVETGSYGTNKGFADIAREFRSGLKVYAAGSYRKMQGQSLSYSEFSGVDSGVTGKTADAENSGSMYANMSMRGWTLQANTSKRTKGIPTSAFGSTFNDSRTETTDSRSFMELRKEAPLSGELNLTARIYYDWYYYRGLYMADNSAPPPAQLANNDFSKAAWYGGENRFQYDFGGDNILILGQEYEKNITGVQGSDYSDPYQKLFEATYTPYRWALFTQQELRPAPELHLTLGGRYDRYESFGHTLNPRFAAVYDLPYDTTLKFMAGSAFKTPTPSEMYYTFPGLNKGNEDLKPETIRTYEAHCEHKLPEKLGHVSIGYFENRIKNLISQTVDPSDGLTYFINNERILSKGLELTAKLRAGRRLSGHAGYIRQDTRVVGGGRLSNSPRHTGNVGITGRLPAMDASAGLELFMVGPRTTFRETRLRSAALLSLNLSAKPWKAGPRCYLGVYNLTNANYQASGAAEHTQPALGQNARNFTLGLEHKF